METHAIFTYLGFGQFQLELDDRQLQVGTFRLVNIQLGRITSSALGRERFVDSAHFCLVFCLQRQGFGLWHHQRQMDRFDSFIREHMYVGSASELQAELQEDRIKVEKDAVLVRTWRETETGSIRNVLSNLIE